MRFLDGMKILLSGKFGGRSIAAAGVGLWQRVELQDVVSSDRPLVAMVDSLQTVGRTRYGMALCGCHRRIRSLVGSYGLVVLHE